MGAGEEIFTDTVGQFFKLTWQETSLTDGLVNGDERLRKKILAVLEYKAPQVENYMKTNAPWTDRTGNARQGLRAQAYDDGGTNMGIVLYQQVPYGIWLEIANSSQYAIIMPTVDALGPEVMAACERIMEQI